MNDFTSDTIALDSNVKALNKSGQSRLILLFFRQLDPEHLSQSANQKGKKGEEEKEEKKRKHFDKIAQRNFDRFSHDIVGKLTLR